MEGLVRKKDVVKYQVQIMGIEKSHGGSSLNLSIMHCRFKVCIVVRNFIALSALTYVHEQDIKTLEVKCM